MYPPLGWLVTVLDVRAWLSCLEVHHLARFAQPSLLSYVSPARIRPSLHPNEGLHALGSEFVTLARRQLARFAQRVLIHIDLAAEHSGRFQEAEPSLWLKGCCCS
jgi:hypothetical protein